MEETKNNAAQHVEQFQNMADMPDSKAAKVLSVALTDAVAKDQPSRWSRSMIQLYGIMLLVTISLCPSLNLDDVALTIIIKMTV